MKSNSKKHKDLTERIQEISEKFGSPSKDDKKVKKGDSIFYRDSKFQVVEGNIEFPENDEDLKNIIDLLEEYDRKDIDFDYDDKHPIVDGSPYQNCANNLQDLLNITKEKIRDFIIELEEEDPKYGRLEKPNFIGFYRPFHFWPISWGIYLNLRLINQEGRRIFNFNKNFKETNIPNLSLRDAKLLSFFHTYFHEMYHHKFELLGTKLDISLRMPVYKDSFHKFYCETLYTDSCLEEAFANVFGLNKALDYIFEKKLMNYKRKDLELIMRESMLKNAPRGYRVAYEITGISNRKDESYYENQFLEILLDFTHRVLFNNQNLTSVDPMVWEMFTYRLDPLINKNNPFTFYIP